MSNAIIKIIGNSINALSFIAPKTASTTAMDLFATPRKGRVTDEQKDFLNSAEIINLKYDHLNISTYHWKGSNSTILLAHGWESNSHRWEPLITELRALDYNIVALDAPAHGATNGKQFNAVLYSECINVATKHYKPEIIIGHSVGGMASGFYQYNYQNKDLEKLILLGAPSEFVGVFKRYVDMMGYNKRVENGLNKIVTERFNNEPSYFSLANFAKKIDTETLIIHDVNDKIIPFNDAELIVNNHKNAKLITTNGYGHGLRNATIYKHVIDFIKS